MFTSLASSHSSSGTFGCPPVFGQGSQKEDAFAPKILSSETVFGTTTETSKYGGSSTWAFPKTSSPSSSTTTFGAPSYTGFGSSTSTLGYSSSGNFGSPSVCKQWNQRGDTFASKSLNTANVLGSQTGMENSHGTSTWAFNQTSSPLSTPTTFGALSSYGFGSSTSVGPHVTRSTFDLNQSHFGGQERGSRIENYKRTPEIAYSAEKVVSISAMPVYNAKSHEELRWEDYKFSDRGGFGFSSSAAKSTSSSLSPFTSSPVTNFSTNSWGSTSVSTTPITPNPFEKSFHSAATEMPTWKFPGPTSTTHPLHFSSSTNDSLSTITSTPSNSFNPFLPRTNLTSPASTSPLNQNPFTNPFTSLPTQTCSSTLSGPTSTTFTPGVVTIRSSLDDFWSTSIGGPSISMVTTPANSVSGPTFNQPTTLLQHCVPSTQNYNGATTGIIGQITSTDQTSSAPTPFGTLPPKSHLSFECSQLTQYGISSIPVKDKPALVKHPLLTTKHFSRRNKLPVQKYDPKLNRLKMPFFSDTKEIPVAAFLPRENPRALVIKRNIHEQKLSDSMYENEKDAIKIYASSNDPIKEKNKFSSVLDVPLKLQLPDYYTEPQISELESKERAEPGFCSHVNDFVIGRHGYGSIKFLGETDVRKLDLESYVQFNKREVTVYMDDTKKPPIGKGLNKPAEITLLNIKCIDKRSGVEWKDGLKIDKYIEMLKKKAVAQGAEFISYDPVEGEWKFRVQHF